jgi:uncharacterized 2Fe-2S/4Fe-4S cluster protein (DUF4445 family)
MEPEQEAFVVFQPAGRRGDVALGATVLEASRRLGVDIEGPCGGLGICGKCKVRIEAADGQQNVSDLQDVELDFISDAQLSEGYRLGCCAELKGDVLVFVPEESRAGKQVVSKAARDIHIDWNPAVKFYDVQVAEATLDDPTADFERVVTELKTAHRLEIASIDHHALMQLSSALRAREGLWTASVGLWMDKEILSVRSESVRDYYGVAIDIGTTTVAAYLCNLCSKEVVNTASMMNPQCRYGEDVMSRIAYLSANADGLARMNRDIIEGVNNLIEQLCEGLSAQAHTSVDEEAEADDHITSADVMDLTVVGNTVMHHIFLRLDPRFVGLSPFPPVIHRGLDIKARDLGIKVNPSAYVHVLPNEAGFVGADNVGVLIAEEPHSKDEVQLIIDIGTNGELVLGNRKKLLSCSCATGPALEGAQIKFGMRAAPGAIERIIIDPETHDVDYKVIGRDQWKRSSDSTDMRAKGICGSGILDALAELYRTGVVLKSGLISAKTGSNRIRPSTEGKGLEFVVAWERETSIGTDIVITQNDIRQVQMAKAALYCGCKLMMRRLGVQAVDKLKIAGSFGNHVDRLRALVIGLFPDCAVEVIESIGNAAGDGARAALLNREKRAEANEVALEVEYIELTTEPGFQAEFARAMHIPHMRDAFPHLEGIVPPDVLHQR